MKEVRIKEADIRAGLEVYVTGTSTVRCSPEWTRTKDCDSDSLNLELSWIVVCP